MRENLFRQYYSNHYSRFMAETIEHWEHAVSRIELNFGEFFSIISRNERICDVACGVGYLEYYLLKRGFTMIDAVDLSGEMVDVAKSSLQQFGLDVAGSVRFYHSDAFEYLRREHGYKAIAAIDFMEHLEKEKVIEFLNICYNAMDTGGFLFARVTNADNPLWGRFFYHDFTHETPFTPDSLWQCLRLGGFEPVKIGYEAVPIVRQPTRKPIARLKALFPWRRLWLVSKLLAVPVEAFAENLIAVAKKPR